MAPIFDPAKKSVLNSEARHQTTRPLELLAWAGVRAGQTVLDLGCGTGFFTIPAAQLVGPNGKVLATDIQPEMLAAIKSAVTAQGLTNVEIFPGQEYELSRHCSVDWALLAFVLHEVSDPARLTALALKMLAPGGRILVIEWPKEEGPKGPPLKVRLSPEEILALAQPLGLAEVQCRDLRPHYYAMVLQVS
jgi:ubiquinone/menaquinone biosynthesis C-methylase UbiE